MLFKGCESLKSLFLGFSVQRKLDTKL